MKRLWIGLGVVVVGSGGWLSISAMQYEPRVRPGVSVGPVAIGGLSRSEAMRRVRLWWETEKLRELEASVPTKAARSRFRLSQLGFAVDDVSSIEPAPLDGFWDGVRRSVAREDLPDEVLPLVLKPSGADLQPVRQFVSRAAGEPTPARVVLRAGAIQRIPEGTRMALDEAKLREVVAEAIRTQDHVVLPVTEGTKRVPDEELETIREVVGEFSTRFPARQHDRNANIRLAASRLDGHVLMPGETLSFNRTVGERKAKDGFRLAGVYRDGRHDVDIGGGICQVSTTLYNAVVLSNLKVVRRQNHSMPVAYVPLGRDAAVSYGAIDMEFQNSAPHPVAISSSFEPGKLTFRILGQKDPGTQVKIVSQPLRSWDLPVKYQVDRSLPPGKQRVIEKGSRGHAAVSYRIVLRNGVQVSKEVLARSFYRGGARIIAHNPPSGAGPLSPVASSPNPPENLATPRG